MDSNKYKRDIQLRCETCGGEEFESNEDKSYVECKLCNREYHGGYDELVEYNHRHIQDNLDKLEAEAINDSKKEFADNLKKSLKGNKYIKFK